VTDGPGDQQQKEKEKASEANGKEGGRTTGADDRDEILAEFPTSSSLSLPLRSNNCRNMNPCALSASPSPPLERPVDATSLNSPVRLSARLPTALPAREGRAQQKYDVDGARLVAGCVPYHCDAASGAVHVLLISNRRRTQWIIPKGGWETDETQVEAAGRESYEEAGVRGVVGELLATYTHMGKHNQPQHHAYFALKISEVLRDWPDKGKRRRVWVALGEAGALCTRPGMAEAIAALQRKFGVAPAPLSQASDIVALAAAAGDAVDTIMWN
jgi:diphosphoinositol-polyphosphate diphosphatase